MKRTKTLQAMVDKANQYLGMEDDSDKAKHGRQTLITFVSAMLMEAKSYKGFNYTYWTMVGYEEWVRDGQPEDTKDNYIYGASGDKTRVYFY